MEDLPLLVSMKVYVQSYLEVLEYCRPSEVGGNGNRKRSCVLIEGARASISVCPGCLSSAKRYFARIGEV